MRITIVDQSNYARDIVCDDPAILGAWFNNIIRKLMSDNMSFQNHRIQVWPETEEERILAPKDWYYKWVDITQDNILEWAKHLTELSAELGEKENVARRT